ncbi:RecQ family zinc-binding domain-containing protein [Glaciihabitans sp. dw_435]|uniref:RecQ family zinc-binding domain-containing protein n=1 Tax=Glaciihabitans sp. dw_435 TaxID=2720081 RepID=UPI0027DB0E5F|nr:RecQ family zinc-binding domain-containing protein [Glaciihabitans sp. dw_435]
MPRSDDLARVFTALVDAGGPTRVADIARAVALSEQGTARLVNLLEEAGVVVHDHLGVTADPAITAEDAALRGVAAGRQRERIEHSRIAMMRAYAETRRCRRQLLLGYFGEELPAPCGNCDTCSSGSAYAPEFAVRQVSAFPEGATVVHAAWGTGIVMSEEGDSLTVFFDREGYKVLSLSVIGQRHLLALA